MRGRPLLSLRVQLLGLVALSTLFLVSAATTLQLRFTLRSVERETLDAARATALGVAAELTERDRLPTPQELQDIAEQFRDAVPTLRALTVIRDEPDRDVLHASTEPAPPAEAFDLALAVMSRHDAVISDERPGPVRHVAVPLERARRAYGAVIVTMSMERVARIRNEVRGVALVAVPLSVLALTAVIGLLGRALVDRPLGEIRETVRRAGARDLHARAQVFRDDELGRLARGLNAMLDQIRDFNLTLQDEVRRATEELQHRNRLLEENAQRLFAARRELARAEQLAVAGRMAAAVAHEIGTPLNLISGYVQMLLEGAPAGSTEAARLRTVREQIERVTTIVQGLLDQARLPPLRKRPLLPAELIASVGELARPTAERAGVRLELMLADGLPGVLGDLGQLEQVFLNLVTNALDAMPGGGTLTLEARPAGDQVEFLVCDSGMGIPAVDIGRVFEPLFTTKEPGAGTGLGLAIVRDVLHAHGGTVRLESQPGSGTTVYVALPAVPVAAHA